MTKTTVLFAGLAFVAAIAASGQAEGPMAGAPAAPAASRAERKGAWAESRPSKSEVDNWSSPTSDQIRDSLSILREIDADKAQRVETWLQSNPERARSAIRPIFPKLSQLQYLKTQSPELFKLRVEDFKMNAATTALATQYRQAVQAADQAKAKTVADQLHAKVGEHFAVRQKLQEAELAMLEKRIAALHQQIDLRKKSQGELIDQRYKELTSTDAQPAW